jgi:predicted porin
MKKLLMCSAAIALGLAVAAPAKADGIKLDLAGHFKGYVTWLSQDNTGAPTGTQERHFDILRETEIHFTGETTLDNGLTVGVHHEADIDSQNRDGFQGSGQDIFVTEESYAYFSGAWGRVNFGKEDGANYLLEVAAPSADENFDVSTSTRSMAL